MKNICIGVMLLFAITALARPDSMRHTISTNGASCTLELNNGVRAINLMDVAQRNAQPTIRKTSYECGIEDGIWAGGRWCYRFRITRPWNGELPQWPSVDLKPMVTDWTAYDRLVVDVFNSSVGGDVLSMFIAQSDGRVQNGLTPRSLPMKDYGYQRWIVDLKKWPKTTDPKKIGRIHLFFTTPNTADIHISGFHLLKRGEPLPPVSEEFLTTKVRPARILAEKVQKERRQKALERFINRCRIAGQDGRFAWIGKATSMDKIRPRDNFNAEGASSFSLKLARGEYESLQVLVMPSGENLSNVTVETSIDGIPAKAFKTSVVGYVNTVNLPPYKSAHNVASKKPGGYERKTCAVQTGWWPDPILDYLDKTDITGNDLQGFWVRLKCPDNQQAGIYNGTITVKGKKGTDSFSLKFPLTVRVYNFSVPKKSPLPLAITFSPTAHLQFATEDDKTLAKKLKDDPQSPINAWKKHELAWGDFLADYYITMDSLYHSGEKSIHWDVLLKLKEQGRLGLFNLGYWDYPWSMKKENLEKWKAAMQRKFAPAYQKAKELGLLEYAYLYGCDEINKKYFENIAYALAELKKMFPGVPLFTTAYDHNFGTGESKLKQMDWFTPTTVKFAEHFKKIDKARENGHQVWWYICCDPHAPYANLFLEHQGIEARQLMGAQTVKWRPDGFLYYQTSIWNSFKPISGTSAFTDWNPRSWMQYHGDGSWFCCGPDGTPCATIRMENFRDGLEDFAYALEYERRTGKKCEVPVEIYRNLNQFTDDPNVYYAWRDSIAEAIEHPPAQ